MYGLCACLIVIVLRLFYLQIKQTAFFCTLGEKNFLKTEVIPPLRGNLYDCNGVLLAANRPIFDLCWQGRGAYRLTKQHVALLRNLGGVLECDFIRDNNGSKNSACTQEARVRYQDNSQDNKLSQKYHEIVRAERYTRRITLKRDLTFDQLCKISEQYAGDTCGSQSLVIENRFERVYPYKTLASHVLGYLSRIEHVGRDGLEKFFDDELGGQMGYVMNVINSTGKKLHQKEHKEPCPGDDISLTIDFELQAIAEAAFDKDQAGTLLLMDPEDGALRVLHSQPNFDSNIFLMPISHDMWQEKLTVNNPLLNRATRALYPPASIFKLVTIAAGLEENVIDPDTMFTCKGYVRFCKRNYLCQRRWGHGNVLLKDALAFSCNIPCFEIAQKISIDTLAEYAFRFGLGNKTNFLLDECSGLVPTSTWKLALKGERWWTGETLSASIGQSYLLVTPLQLVRMMCSIETGCLVKPRILETEAVEKEDMLISQKTRDFLKEAMSMAVAKGTVRRLRHFKDFTIYGKTGTAQTCSLQTKKTSKEHYEHAWLAGVVQYKDTKPMALVILVEHVGASRYALAIAQKFLARYAQIVPHSCA